MPSTSSMSLSGCRISTLWGVGYQILECFRQAFWWYHWGWLRCSSVSSLLKFSQHIHCRIRLCVCRSVMSSHWLFLVSCSEGDLYTKFRICLANKMGWCSCVPRNASVYTKVPNCNHQTWKGTVSCYCCRPWSDHWVRRGYYVCVWCEVCCWEQCFQYQGESRCFRVERIDVHSYTQEADIGIAADVGSLAYLPKVTGNQSLLRELAYTARNFSASEAEKLGLVSQVVPGGRDQVVQAALGLAKTIAEKSPVAVSGTKRLISHARDHSVEENLMYTQSWNAHALMTNVSCYFGIFLLRRLNNFSCRIWKRISSRSRNGGHRDLLGSKFPRNSERTRC